MGTTWSLRVDNPRMLPLDALRHTVQSSLDDVVAQMSHWDPDSALGRFNRAPAGSTHTLPEAFNVVLARALHWAEASGGAFDPAMGPLVALWGFGPEAAAQSCLPPDAAALAAARVRCGRHRIVHNAMSRELVQPGGLSLDLSGIAKGYGVDVGVAALQRLGLTDFLLEVGGELRGVGRRPGGLPWQVQVDPGAAPGLRIALADRAVATSGERWQVHERAGRRWSHTLDPRTGEPVAHALASVTVLHEQCMDADALATVLTVMGIEDGRAFADRHGVAALFAQRESDGTLALHPSAAWVAQAAA